MLWLQNGDKNTKFFHATTSQRQRKNRIGGLMDEGGVWHEEQGATEKLILSTSLQSLAQINHWVLMQVWKQWTRE